MISEKPIVWCRAKLDVEIVHSNFNSLFYVQTTAWICSENAQRTMAVWLKIAAFAAFDACGLILWRPILFVMDGNDVQWCCLCVGLYVCQFILQISSDPGVLLGAFSGSLWLSRCCWKVETQSLPDLLPPPVVLFKIYCYYKYYCCMGSALVGSSLIDKTWKKNE